MFVFIAWGGGVGCTLAKGADLISIRHWFTHKPVTISARECIMKERTTGVS